jgi:hypothetical protein
LTNNDQRASREEILDRLDHLLGPEARTVLSQVVAHLEAGEIEQGLSTLKEFDTRIGGVGLHNQADQKLPGAHRPLTYVHTILRSAHPERFTRFAIHASCAHVEYVLKEAARLGLFGRIRASRWPLGTIVKQTRGQLAPSLYENLSWLSKRICNFAKHDFDTPEGLEDGDSLGVHLFDLEEAIAVYFVARRLAVIFEESRTR